MEQKHRVYLGVLEKGDLYLHAVEFLLITLSLNSLMFSEFHAKFMTEF